MNPRLPQRIVLLLVFFAAVTACVLLFAYFFCVWRSPSTIQEKRTFLYFSQIGMECFSLAVTEDQVPPVDLEQLSIWLYSMQAVLPRSQESIEAEKWLRKGLDAWGTPLHVDVSTKNVWRLWSSGPNQVNEDGSGDDIGIKIDFGSNSQGFPKTLQFLRSVPL